MDDAHVVKKPHDGKILVCACLGDGKHIALGDSVGVRAGLYVRVSGLSVEIVLIVYRGVYLSHHNVGEEFGLALW